MKRGDQDFYCLVNWMQLFLELELQLREWSQGLIGNKSCFESIAANQRVKTVAR